MTQPCPDRQQRTTSATSPRAPSGPGRPALREGPAPQTKTTRRAAEAMPFGVQLVPSPVRAAVLGPPRRHRDLRPETRSPWPGPGHRHPPPPWTATRSAASRSPPGSVAAVQHTLMSLLALNGLRVSEATGADSGHLGLERGHRTLVITRKGGKVVKIPLAPRTARPSTWRAHERPAVPRRGRETARPARHLIVATYIDGAARQPRKSVRPSAAAGLTAGKKPRPDNHRCGRRQRS